jgi:hypothetical protein
MSMAWLRSKPDIPSSQRGFTFLAGLTLFTCSACLPYSLKCSY